MIKKCVECENLNRSICYTTNPPQYKCNLDNSLHFIDSKCTIEISEEERLDKLLKEVE